MGEPIKLKCGVEAEVAPLYGRPGGHLRLSLNAYPHPHHYPITRSDAAELALQLLEAAGVEHVAGLGLPTAPPAATEEPLRPDQEVETGTYLNTGIAARPVGVRFTARPGRPDESTYGFRLSRAGAQRLALQCLEAGGVEHVLAEAALRSGSFAGRLVAALARWGEAGGPLPVRPTFCTTGAGGPAAVAEPAPPARQPTTLPMSEWVGRTLPDVKLTPAQVRLIDNAFAAPTVTAHPPVAGRLVSSNPSFDNVPKGGPALRVVDELPPAGDVEAAVLARAEAVSRRVMEHIERTVLGVPTEMTFGRAPPAPTTCGAVRTVRGTAFTCPLDAGHDGPCHLPTPQPDPLPPPAADRRVVEHVEQRVIGQPTTMVFDPTAPAGCRQPAAPPPADAPAPAETWRDRPPLL